MIDSQHRNFVVQPHNLFTYADPKGSEISAGKQHSTNFRALLHASNRYQQIWCGPGKEQRHKLRVLLGLCFGIKCVVLDFAPPQHDRPTL
jgi:hypothetical protein